MKAIFIVGPPGSGKTTLVRAWLGMQGRELPPGSYMIDKPKWTMTPRFFAAGHYTGDTFDGADMVPYNGAASALDWLEVNSHGTSREAAIFDGDRFSNAKAFARVQEIVGVGNVRVAHLTGDAELLTARRAARGSNQNPSWMKGRETKAKNFGANFNALDILSSSPTDLLLHGLEGLLQ